MPVQHRPVDLVVDGAGRRRVVGGKERELPDAIWDQTMNEIPKGTRVRRPRHHPLTSCDLCAAARHADHNKRDVAASGNEPHVPELRHGPPGSSRCSPPWGLSLFLVAWLIWLCMVCQNDAC